MTTQTLPFRLLRIPTWFATQGAYWDRLLQGRGDVAALRRGFALTRPEHRFAVHLLRQRTHIWVFRSHQRACCGDFVLVDLSSPDPKRRAIRVVELKHGAALREGRVGLQMRCWRDAVLELQARGIVAPGAPVSVWTGGNDAVWQAIG